MKIIILANDEVAYSGILSYPILKKFSDEISGIFIQDGILNSDTNSADLFNKVKKKSGLQYAIFLAREILNYKIAVFIRRIFHMNKHSDDCYLDTNSNLGKIFDIPVFKIKGSIHDEIWLNKINDLEPDRRDIYSGAVGFFDFTGNVNTCIAIRTMIMKDQTVHFQSGAGIVHDSDPTKEFEETVNKAKAIMTAINFAENGLVS